MKTSTILLRLALVGIFLLSWAFSSPAVAHQVGDKNGKANHRHVYKSIAYGKTVTVGHYAQPAGGVGIVIWQASPSRNYGKIRPGFSVPQGHAPQASLKQVHQQNPVFSKNQRRTPNFSKN